MIIRDKSRSSHYSHNSPVSPTKAESLPRESSEVFPIRPRLSAMIHRTGKKDYKPQVPPAKALPERSTPINPQHAAPRDPKTPRLS